MKHITCGNILHNTPQQFTLNYDIFFRNYCFLGDENSSHVPREKNCIKLEREKTREKKKLLQKTIEQCKIYTRASGISTSCASQFLLECGYNVYFKEMFKIILPYVQLVGNNQIHNKK